MSRTACSTTTSPKIEVLQTVFRENPTELLERFDQVAAADEPADEKLLGIVKILLRTWRNDPDLVTVMVREVGRSAHLASQIEDIDSVCGDPAGDRAGPGRGRVPLRARRPPRELGGVRGSRGDPDRLGDGEAPWTATRRSPVPSARSSTSSRAGPPGRPPSPEAVAAETLVLGAGALGLAWALTTTGRPTRRRSWAGTRTRRPSSGLVLAAEGAFALTRRDRAGATRSTRRWGAGGRSCSRRSGRW